MSAFTFNSENLHVGPSLVEVVGSYGLDCLPSDVIWMMPMVEQATRMQVIPMRMVAWAETMLRARAEIPALRPYPIPLSE